MKKILFTIIAAISAFCAMEASTPMRRINSETSDYPLSGEVRSLVLLVEYTDVAFTVTDARNAFSRMLNEEGYSDNLATGSAADYFKACSSGAFRPIFDVYGVYTLPHNRAYYGANNASGNDQNPTQMIIDACMLASAAGVNFADYDTDNDGTVDNVFVYYAGTNPAEGGPEDAVWPHRYAIYQSVRIDGKLLYNYACTSELTLNGTRTGSMCGIGTFCHEFSHVLGLPDMYNTKNSNAYTVGGWDIMASGNYNNNGRTPPAYSAFERFMLGWMTPVQLTGASTHTLLPIETTNTAYLIADRTHNMSSYNPSPNEYWMVENRQHTGWDTPDGAIPGVGLVISHITFSQNAWTYNTFNNSKPLGYDICEAYNSNPSSSSASDSYPGSLGITSFIPTLNNGSQLTDLQLRNIRYIDSEEILFRFGPPGDEGLAVEPEVLPTLYNYILNGKYDRPAEPFVICGHKLQDSLVFATVSDTRYFDLSTDSTNWTSDTLWLPTTGDSIRTRLYVRYIGTSLCKQRKSNLSVGTKNREEFTQSPLVGYAERPTLIDTVHLQASEATLPYGYIARWEEQSDAEVYYLTLCKWTDEEQKLTQDFEGFTTEEKIEAEGWWANFIRRSSSCYDGKSSLHLTTTGDMVRTETYLSPVSEISFWVSHNYRASEDDSHGICLVEATADGVNWTEIDRIRITATSRSTVKTYQFKDEESYTCFRISNAENSGSGGLLIDAFTALMPRTAEFLYRNKEYPIYAPADSVLIAGLNPATTYSYQLTCMEDKGCDTHWSVISRPLFFTTMDGSDDATLTLVCHGGAYTVYMSETPGNKTLYAYDLSGRMVWKKTIVPEEYVVTLPRSAFVAGNVYLLKYSETDRLRRKDRRVKFLFR